MDLLKPAARCPACGAPPRWRIPASERERALPLEPAVPLGTYQCHTARCGTVYVLTAAAYQRAA